MGPAHEAALQLARDISDGLLPRSRAWHEIWLGETLVSGGAVEKHVASIFTKLGLPPGESDNRRVLAVLRYLGA